jgi:hypothetical protein
MFSDSLPLFQHLDNAVDVGFVLQKRPKHEGIPGGNLGWKRFAT